MPTQPDQKWPVCPECPLCPTSRAQNNIYASEQPSRHPKPSSFLNMPLIRKKMRTYLMVNLHHRRRPDGLTPSRSDSTAKKNHKGESRPPPPHLTQLKTDTQTSAAITTTLPKTKPCPITYFDRRSVRRSSRNTNRGVDKIVRLHGHTTIDTATYAFVPLPAKSPLFDDPAGNGRRLNKVKVFGSSTPGQGPSPLKSQKRRPLATPKQHPPPPRHLPSSSRKSYISCG